jgi:hypothetical protein
VSQGEVIGSVGNNNSRHQGGTTYHLHFDVQVPTRDGWVFVSPYMTLVAAYERLIGGRGRVVNDAMFTSASSGPVAPPVISEPAGTLDQANGQDLANSSATSQPRPDDAAKPASPGALAVPNIVAERSVDDSRKDAREHRTEAVERCATRFVKGRRRRICRIDIAETRWRARHPFVVRAMGRAVSHPSYRARRHGGHLHTRHARGASRHGRA